MDAFDMADTLASLLNGGGWTAKADLDEVKIVTEDGTHFTLSVACDDEGED
jgi:hypothetical protein